MPLQPLVSQTEERSSYAAPVVIDEVAPTHVGVKVAAAPDVVLREQLQQRNIRVRRLAIGFYGYLGVTLPISIGLHHRLGQERFAELISSPAGITTSVLVWSLWGIAIGFAMKSRRGAREAVESLKQAADVSSIGVLLDSLSLDDAVMKRYAIDALIDLLPLLQPEDAGRLSTIHRARLCSVLGRRLESPLYKDIAAVFKPAEQRRVNLQLAILKAFSQVGDERALSHVKNLAISTAHTDGEQQVRSAAIECLPLLQARIVSLSATNSLLRPSSAMDLEYLVRPATHAPVATEDLLRPAEV